MDDLPDALARLTARLEALEQRVCALEHPAQAASFTALLEANPTTAAESAAELQGSTVGTFSVLGKAMLGVAGAYLLRAVAESNVLPSAAVAAVAIVYALAWLVWASRAKSGDWLTGTVYAGTSALILAPMLWELMFRFNVLTASTAAAIVAGFAVATWALAWKREIAPVWWVANLAAAATALVLAIASHQLIPFIAVLLALVLMSEYDVLRGRVNGVRVLVSLAADAAIWALVFIYASQESTRESYPRLGAAALILPGLLLFFIVGACVIYETLRAKKRITVFETIQTTAAFLLAACGLLYFGLPASVIGFGIACLALAGIGYVLVLTRFKSTEERRNLLVFASWSGLLMLAGSMMCLPKDLQSVWLGSWAVAASWAGARILRVHFQLHALVFLLAASVGSGLLNWMASELAGAAAGGTAMVVYLVALMAIVCYVGAARNRDEKWKQPLFVIVFAVMSAGVLAALMVQGLTALVALKMIPGAHHLAFIRTLSVCVLAIGLALGGAKLNRAELTKIGYATLALLAVKLVVEDLRLGHLAFIAASISLFAVTLIVVPRVARLTPKVKGALSAKVKGITPLPH